MRCRVARPAAPEAIQRWHDQKPERSGPAPGEDVVPDEQVGPERHQQVFQDEPEHAEDAPRHLEGV